MCGWSGRGDCLRRLLEEPRRATSENKPPATAASPESAPAAAPSSTPRGPAAQPAATAPGRGDAQGRRAQPPPPPAPKPATYTLAAGTAVSVRTISSISTKTATAGQPFQATLNQPLTVKGVVIAPRGADVAGKVIEADSGGKVKGKARLVVNLTSVATADGQRLHLPTSALAQEAKSTKKKDALKIGIGAGAGAAIGAIAGGGTGAAIGAAAGGGAGTGAVLLTKGDAAVLPAETVLEFHLSAPAKVTEKKPGSLGGK